MNSRSRIADIVSQTYFAKQLKVNRRKQGLTQEGLARLAKVRVSVVRKLEDPSADIWRIKVTTMLRIAHALDLRLSVNFEDFETLSVAVQELLNPKRLERLVFEEEFPALGSR